MSNITVSIRQQIKVIYDRTSYEPEGEVVIVSPLCFTLYLSDRKISYKIPFQLYE